MQQAMRPAVGHEDAPVPFASTQSPCTALSVCAVSPVVSVQAPFRMHANCEPLVSLAPLELLLLHAADSIAPTTSEARKNDWLIGDMPPDYRGVGTVSRSERRGGRAEGRPDRQASSVDDRAPETQLEHMLVASNGHGSHASPSPSPSASGCMPLSIGRIGLNTRGQSSTASGMPSPSLSAVVIAPA
jgi:hypothetical protein